MQIFDKSGNTLFGPKHIGVLWNGCGSDWVLGNITDPIILYDEIATNGL